MAKVIEFYIPSRFQRRVTWVPQQERGKLIEFPSQMADNTPQPHHPLRHDDYGEVSSVFRFESAGDSSRSGRPEPIPMPCW
jgi:hypothetical protein